MKPRGPININYECQRNGLTVFGRAVLQGQFMIANIIMNHGNADKDFINDMDSKSILEIAIDNRNFKAIDYLLN